MKLALLILPFSLELLAFGMPALALVRVAQHINLRIGAPAPSATDAETTPRMRRSATAPRADRAGMARTLPVPSGGDDKWTRPSKVG
jgi:hypothetical protein